MNHKLEIFSTYTRLDGKGGSQLHNAKPHLLKREKTPMNLLKARLEGQQARRERKQGRYKPDGPFNKTVWSLFSRRGK